MTSLIRLETLTLHKCNQLTPGGLLHLKHLRIQKLDISQNPQFRDTIMLFGPNGQLSSIPNVIK